MQGNQFPYPVLSGVTRPDGTSVQFNYGDWLIVNDIQELSKNGALRYETSYNFPKASDGQLSDPPAYSQQTTTTFDKDGNAKLAVWSYQTTLAGSLPGEKLVSCFAVTDPVGTIHMTTFSTGGDVFDGLPIQATTATGSNTPCTNTPSTIWHSVSTAWTSDTDSSNNPTGINPRPQAKTTVLSDGTTQSQLQIAGYDDHGNPTDIKHFDFGSGKPGPLLREAVLTYATNLGNIFGLPTDIQVKDGGGNLLTREKLIYDDYSTTPLGTVNQVPPGFDSANFGGTTAPPRGNLTGTTTYTNAAAGTGAINSTFTYDIFGNKRTSLSGCCRQEASVYSASTQYAYPDSVSIGPSGTQLKTSFTYDMTSGSVTTVTDFNGQKTHFSYDIDNRLTTTTPPDNVTVTSTYDDASENLAVTVSSTTSNAITKSVKDFLGRSLLNEILNGSAIVSTTAFVNDAMGRPTQASNPYGPNDTALYTSYVYDPLGRTTSVTPPALAGTTQNNYQVQYSPTTFTDSAGVTHSGLSMQLTNPAGKSRLQFSDALGRLMRVDEPNAASNGTNATASVAINGSLASAQSGAPPLASNSAMTSLVFPDGSPHVFYIGNQHVYHLFWSSSAGWQGQDLTVAAGGPLVGSGSGLSSLINAGGCPHVQYVDVNQHVNDLWMGNTSPGCLTTWANGDLMTWTTAPQALPGSPLTSMAVAGDANANVFYVDVNHHINRFVWPKSGTFHSEDLTATTVGPQVGAGSGLSSLINAGGCPHVQYVDVNQHVNDLWMGNSSPGCLSTWANGDLLSWTTGNASVAGSPLTSMAVAGDGNAHVFYVDVNSHIDRFVWPKSGTFHSEDLTATTNVVVDAGTVSLRVGGFTATACFGNSTNSFCNGKPVNTTAAQVASALAQALSVPASGTSAIASGSTINLTWRETGPNTTAIAALISSSDKPTLFPNGSFSTQPTSFSGGQGPPLTNPNSTYYSYDAQGHLLQIIQGQQTRTFQYDSLGRVTQSVIPETGYLAATIQYTDFGSLSQLTDPRVLPGTSIPLTTTFSYDTLNRIKTVTYNDGTPTVNYTYNPPGSSNNTGGRVSNVTNGVSSETYQYDVMGRPRVSSKVIGGQTYEIDYQYNPDGTLASITYPSGRVITYDEDALGRIADIKSNSSSLLTIGSYSPANKVLSETYGNGITGNYNFNNQLQLSAIKYSSSAGDLLNLAYNYGGAEDNGQILGIIDNVTSARGTSYIYDALGRLQTAGTNDLVSANTWQLQFTYDQYGNRLDETPTGGTASMPSNHVLVDATTNHIKSATYDAAGHMTSDGLFNYVFNAAGQMTAVNPLGSTTPLATFSYDAKGLRVIKNGTTYIYSGRKVIAEYPTGTSAASPTVEQIYRGDLRLATIAGGAITYHYADHQSVRVDADSSGTITRTYAHYPFGETWYETGNGDKWKFTSYENDVESGLNYAGARFHSPRLGRFMAIDSHAGHLANPQSFNRYAYVNSDPINFIDPTGKEEDGCDPDMEDCGDGGSGGDGGGDGGSGDDGGQTGDISCDGTGFCVSNPCNSKGCMATGFVFSGDSSSLLSSLADLIAVFQVEPDFEPDPQPGRIDDLIPEVGPGIELREGETIEDVFGPGLAREIPGARYYNYMNLCPLHDEARPNEGRDTSFAGLRYWQVTTRQSMVVVRDFSEGINPNGSWWRVPTEAEIEYSEPCSEGPVVRAGNIGAIIDFALPRVNSATSQSIVTIPAGSTIYFGQAASQQFNYNFSPFALGGGPQIYWPH